MKKKVYHLSNCGTCQRIIAELGIGDEFDYQNIKADPITLEQIEEMEELQGGYEDLFSRRAIKYRKMGLHEQTLTEADYKRLILEEYTFLKRPVFIIGEDIFIGNSKKTVAAIKVRLAKT